MGIIISLWVVLMVPAFILLKYRREDYAVFKAIGWPLFLVMLVAVLVSTNGKKEQLPTKAQPTTPQPAPPGERPRYGLIDRADDVD